MLNVSNAFNEAFKSDLREVKMRVTINDVTYTDEDIISFNYNSSSIVGDTYAIGSTFANSIKLTLCKIVEGLKQLDVVKPEMGIVLPNGSTEFVKLGTFLISEEVNPDRNENRTSLECTDKMLMLDDTYESKLSYPAEIRTVALEIANLAGVEVDKVSFSRLKREQIQKPEGYTYRQAIGLIAQFEAGYATFDRDGLLSIRQLTDKNFEVTPNEYFLKGLVKNELIFRPSGIQVKTGENEADVMSVGSKKGSVIKLDNKLMGQRLLEDIYSKVKNINYYPYTLNWRGNPAVEAGDWLYVTDTKGNKFKVPNLSYTLEYKGGLTAKSSVESVASNEVKFGYKSMLEQAIEYTNDAILNSDGSLVFYGIDEPKNAKEGDVWFKKNGPDTEIWVYERIGDTDKFEWVMKISSAADSTIKDKIEELEKKSKDIEAENNKALKAAEEAKNLAFNSDKISKEALKDVEEAIKKGDGISTNLEVLDDKIKGVASKIEGNSAKIATVKMDYDRINTVVLRTKGHLEKLKLLSDRNYILGTSDTYKSVSFDGKNTAPDKPKPQEKYIDVEVIGYDDYYNVIYKESIRALVGSSMTFKARVYSKYDLIDDITKVVIINEYTKVIFNYIKKTDTTVPEPESPTKPPKETPEPEHAYNEAVLTIQGVDERSNVIYSYKLVKKKDVFASVEAKLVQGYELTSSMYKQMYVTDNTLITFTYKNKNEIPTETKPPIVQTSNIIYDSSKRTVVSGGTSNPLESKLYQLTKSTNQLGISQGDYVEVEFVMVNHNLGDSDGMFQIITENGLELTYYIDINSIPKNGNKFKGVYRIGGRDSGISSKNVIFRIKNFDSSYSFEIKDLSIVKQNNNRMNLMMFSDHLQGLTKVGEINIDDRFDSKPDFIISCYINADYDVGLEIVYINSLGSEIERKKSLLSKKTGYIECNVPYKENVAKLDVYLSNRSSYSYNRGQYKFLQGEIGDVRTPWKLAYEDFATQDKISSLEQTIDGFQLNVKNNLDGMSSQLNLMSNQFSSYVSKFETIDGKINRQDSKIVQLSNQIDLSVTKNNIVSRINMSDERIKIESSLIHLSGKSYIEDAVIKSSMIDDLNANKITAGTINGNRVNIINLNASNITSGELNALYIKARSITGDKLATDAIQVGLRDFGQNIKLSPNAIGFFKDGTLTGKITEDGQEFWYGNNYIGHVGQGSKLGNSSVRGIVNQLSNDGDYIAWSYKSSSYSSSYDAMMVLDPKGRFTGDIGIHMRQPLWVSELGLDSGKIKLMNLNMSSSGRYPALTGSSVRSGVVFTDEALKLLHRNEFIDLDRIVNFFKQLGTGDFKIITDMASNGTANKWRNISVY